MPRLVLNPRIWVAVLIFPLVFVGSEIEYRVVQAHSVAVNVLTRSNNTSRTGANLDELILNTTNVNVARFGKLYERVVDGQIYAQPLYASSVNIPSRGIRNLIYIATQRNKVYAFDADDPNETQPYWMFYIGPWAPSTDFVGLDPDGIYKNIVPDIGITSTPVIDKNTDTIYFVGVVRSVTNGQVQHRHELHALSLSTGQPKPNSPKVIQASVPGCGAPYDFTGTITFDSKQQLQRSALLLLNGVVYFTFASYDDNWPYHGWVFGYQANTLQQQAVFNNTPNGTNGGIWMSGQGLSADSAGNLYLISGNGTFAPNPTPPEWCPPATRPDLGNSYTKLSPALALLSYFTPSNFNYLDQNDLDLGSTGITLIPDADVGGARLLIGGSKTGHLYLLDRDNLGGFQVTGNTQILQSFQAGIGPNPDGQSHLHGSPTYWNSPVHGPMVYIWSEFDKLKSFKFITGTRDNGTTGPILDTTPVATSPMAAPDGMPGGILSLSADESVAGSGIVWASHPYLGDANKQIRQGIIRAFDASNVGLELWNSEQYPARDRVGKFAKFNPVTVARGRVYVPTFSNKLLVYGLFDAVVTVPQDDGRGTTAGTLSAALNQLQTAGGFVGFNLPPGQTTVTVNAPGVQLKIPHNVKLRGSCDDNGPGITIDLNQTAGGLLLEGRARLDGVKIVRTAGPQLATLNNPALGSNLMCVKTAFSLN